jgi:hypothetical protein
VVVDLTKDQLKKLQKETADEMHSPLEASASADAFSRDSKEWVSTNKLVLTA